MTFRKASILDKDNIKELLFKHFGEMAEKRGALDRIDFYTVAEINNEIVAISGIIPPEFSLFNGYEITWTCCKEEYRHKGIVTEILKRCLSELPNDGLPLYCDCWRINFNKDINLSSTMRNLEMKQFFVNVMVYNKQYSVACNTCPYRNESEQCHCSTDLYKKDRK